MLTALVRPRARAGPLLAVALALVVSPARLCAQEALSFAEAEARLRGTHESLAAADLLVRQRREERAAKRAFYWPTITFGAMGVQLSSDIDAEVSLKPLTSLLPLPLPSSLTFQLQQASIAEVNVSARYVLFSGGKVQALNRAAEIEISEAELEARHLAESLDTDLVRRYFGVQARMAARRVRQDAVRLLDRLRFDARRLAEEGLTSRTDRLGAEVAYAEGERELRAAESDVEVARIALASLLSEATAPEVSSPLFVIKDLPPVDEFVVAMRASNPQVARVRAMEALAGEARRGAAGAYKPDVFLFGSQALARAGLNEIVPWGIYGVGATWKVFDGPGRQRTLAAADLQAQRAHTAAARAERDLATLIEVKYREMVKARDQFDTLEAALGLADEHVRARTLAFQEGLATSLEVADAQVRLTRVRVERSAAAYAFVVSWPRCSRPAGRPTGSKSTASADGGERAMTVQARVFRIVGALVLGVVALWALWLTVSWVRRPLPAPVLVLQGQMEATSVDVAGKIPARVEAVHVRLGDRVTKGQVLLTLDSPEARAKLAQARGAQSSARSLEDKARRGARPQEIDAAEANWQRAVVAVEFAEKTFARLDRLQRDGVVAAQRRDEAEAGLRAARDAERAARALYDLAREGARDEDKRAAAGQVAQAGGAVSEVEAVIADTTLVAPIDGEISARNVQPGEIVGAGAPLLSVLDLSDAWATFYVREDALAGLVVGERFDGRVPALADRTVTFQVSYIAAQADFATWRSTTAQGGFDLKTFEVRARPVSPVAGLRPGMSVLVTGGLAGRGRP